MIYHLICNYIYHLKFTNLFFYFSFIHSIVLPSTHCDWINEFKNTLNDFKSSEGNDSIKNIPFLSNLLTSKNEMNCNINMHNFFCTLFIFFDFINIDSNKNFEFYRLKIQKHDLISFYKYLIFYMIIFRKGPRMTS